MEGCNAVSGLEFGHIGAYFVDVSGNVVAGVHGGAGHDRIFPVFRVAVGVDDLDEDFIGGRRASGL